MKDQEFIAEQLVPFPRETVFGFFSDARNLEAITPPWLGFRIVEQSTVKIEQGTELTYRLRVHGLTVNWRSRIDEWDPEHRFVDVQLKGPYAKWHHTHSFHDRGTATLIRDRVLYRLPMGFLGRWVGGRFVASDIKKIFTYRSLKTEELLARPLPSI